MSKKITRSVALAAVAAVAALPLGAGTAQAAGPAPREYANCTALNKVYPHGVGKFGARDKTSGTRVTTFTRNNKVYSLNTKSDRDKDGIACEKA
jgi:hypothetical protein